MRTVVTTFGAAHPHGGPQETTGAAGLTAVLHAEMPTRLLFDFASWVSHRDPAGGDAYFPALTMPLEAGPTAKVADGALSGESGYIISGIRGCSVNSGPFKRYPKRASSWLAITQYPPRSVISANRINSTGRIAPIYRGRGLFAISAISATWRNRRFCASPLLRSIIATFRAARSQPP